MRKSHDEQNYKERRNPNDADVLYNRAQAYILEEQLEDGIYTKKLTRYLMNLTRT